MLTKHEQQSAESLDAIVVLGGEGKAMKRSEKAAEIYNHIKQTQGREITIITTGYCSGLTPISQRPVKEEAESARAREYLKEHGVPEKQILSKDDSLDTLTNFYFAHPLLEKMRTKKVEKASITRKESVRLNIGVTVDSASAYRVKWTAKKVLGRNRYNTHVFGVDEPTGIVGRGIIAAVSLANFLDLEFEHHVPDGNHAAMKDYVERRHPFYAPPRNRDSLYESGVALMRKIKGEKQYMPAIAEDTRAAPQ